jgi:SAM-dependent methyltransferase
VLAEAVNDVGRPLAQVASVLDLGCGAGRVLPHVAALAPAAQCVGCDVDAAAIDWARGAKPELAWVLGAYEPPLPFDDARFELVYAISVFSHLDQGLADRWLAEVRRVLRPGCIALLSVHGAHAFAQFARGSVGTSWCRARAFERGPLGTTEFVFEPYLRSRWTDSDLPGVGDGYGLAFHGSDYLREHWGARIEVVDVHERAVAGWQDLVVCRK